MRVVPVRIIEHEVLIELGAEAIVQVGDAAVSGGAGNPPIPAAGVVLAAEWEAGKDLRAGARRPGVNGLDGGQLVGRHAVGAGRVGGAARQRLRCEATATRVGEDAVRHPVQMVAGVSDGGVEQRAILRCDHRGGQVRCIREDRLLVLHEPGREGGPVIRRRTSDNAVEVVRVALRLHRALAAAHHEAAIPRVREQQFEVDLVVDQALDPAVRDRVTVRDLARTDDAEIDQPHRREIGASRARHPCGITGTSTRPSCQSQRRGHPDGLGGAVPGGCRDPSQTHGRHSLSTSPNITCPARYTTGPV